MKANNKLLKPNPDHQSTICTRQNQQGEGLTVGKVYSVIYDSKGESQKANA
jgi:hypothetical protein